MERILKKLSTVLFCVCICLLVCSSKERRLEDVLVENWYVYDSVGYLEWYVQDDTIITHDLIVGIGYMCYVILCDDSLLMKYPDSSQVSYKARFLNRKSIQLSNDSTSFVINKLCQDPMLEEMFSSDLDQRNIAGEAFAKRALKHYSKHECR